MNRYILAYNIHIEYVAECLNSDGDYTEQFDEWLKRKIKENGNKIEI